MRRIGRRINQVTFFKHKSGDKFCLKVDEKLEGRVQVISGQFKFVSCGPYSIFVTHSSGNFLRISWEETEYQGYKNITLNINDSKNANFKYFKEESLFL